MKTVVLAAAAACVFAASAMGEKYSDPAGFSFEHPQGWMTLTGASLNDVKNAVPPDLKDWIAKNKLDFNSVSVMLIRVGPEDFLENVNVIVRPQQIPVNDRAVAEVTKGLQQQFKTTGAAVESVKGRVAKIGSREAVIVDTQVKLPFVGATLRQRQAIFPGGGKTYVVTCSAMAGTFNRYEPVFDGVLSSFDAPAPVATGFDWGRIAKGTLTGGMSGAVIGGAVGVCLLVVAKLKGKRS